MTVVAIASTVITAPNAVFIAGGGGDNWILTTGFWADSGVWVDSDTWID